MSNPRQFPHVVWLAWRDYLHEWRMSFCFVLALASVLAPMLVLFGLKFGIVTAMVERLVEDPRNREVRPVGAGRFNEAWFAEVRAHPEVGFVLPRTRALAATIQLSSDQSRRFVDAEMIPSAAGDPLLTAAAGTPSGFDRVVLSRLAADKLGVRAGDRIGASLLRQFRGKRERVHLPLVVAGVARVGAFAREGLFVAPELLVAAEDFRDGREVAALGWQGEPGETARIFPGFRLYARSIYDVAALKRGLEAAGVEVRTRAGEIETVQAMDRNLTLIFWIIALVGAIGFSLSLGASLWANVDRKRKELSVLRLVGFNTGGIIWFPVLEALFTGFFGWALAIAIYSGVESGVNTLFSAQLAVGETVCRLLPGHYPASLGLTLLVALLASLLGGVRAAGVEPSEGLREV